MNWRTTGLAWLLVILVGFCAWLVRGMTVNASVASGPSRVFADAPFEVDTIDRLAISREGGEELVFVRGPEGWRQAQPFDVAADGFAVRELLVTLADLEQSRRFESSELPEGASPAGLGLDPPLAVVEVSAGDARRRIELGRRTVAGRAWIRLGADGPILVVGDGLHAKAVEDDPRNWRSRRLFPGRSEIDGIEIANGEVSIRLEREGRRWVMDAPVSTRADTEAVDRMLGVIDRTEHDGFIVDTPDDLDGFGLDQPVARVSIRRGEGFETLLIGSPSGLVGRGRYAMVEGVPTVLRIEETTLRGLLPPVVSFIDPVPSGISGGDVKSIEIVPRSGGSVYLERDLNRWRIERTEVAGGGAETGFADPDTVDELLNLLADNRAPEVIVQAFPGDMAEANVTFLGWDGQPIDTVRVAREPDDGRWALDNGDGVLRVLPASTALPLALDAWTVTRVQP